jgi:hypothetical protein
MDIDTQTHLENGGLVFKDKARHHPRVLSKETSNLKTPYYGIFEASALLFLSYTVLITEEECYVSVPLLIYVFE